MHWRANSNALDELPMQVCTNLLPNRVLHVQLLARLQELKALQEVVQLQQLAEFVQHVGVAQKILALRRTVLHKRSLDFFEHAS